MSTTTLPRPPRASSLRGAASLLALALLLAHSGSARAQDAVPAEGALSDSAVEARTREIASQLRCVVCQGLSVQDSPSELAQQMKNLVRDQVREGKSAEEIKAYFVGRYGEFVLLRPEPRGINLLVYVLPLVALLGGGLLLVFAVRGWTRAPADDDDDEIDAPDPMEPRSSEPVG